MYDIDIYINMLHFCFQTMTTCLGPVHIGRCLACARAFRPVRQPGSRSDDTWHAPTPGPAEYIECGGDSSPKSRAASHIGWQWWTKKGRKKGWVLSKNWGVSAVTFTLSDMAGDGTTLEDDEGIQALGPWALLNPPNWKLWGRHTMDLPSGKQTEPWKITISNE